MKAELIDISGTKKNLDIEIPKDVVDDEIVHIAQEFARKARVPGFRPGKAPVHVVRTRFRDEIVSEMMQHLLPKYFRDAVEERKLDVVVQTPHFEKVDYSNGEPLRFKAVFEVYPEFEISNYLGVPVEQVAVEVQESEIDESLKKLQEDMAEMIPVEERAIQEGDFAEISFSGTIQNSEEPPIALSKAVCEVGAPTTLKEFTENLVGTRPGDEKSFSVTYRDEYPEKKLAGKTVDYQCKIEAIKEKKIPDLNDEFAQGFGAFQTLDEFRAKIRQDMEKHKRDHANEKMRVKMLEWLEDHNEFEIPETLVEKQLESRLQRLIRDLSRQGIHPERLDVDWGKVREEQRQNSVRDVKGTFILEYISEKENISVTAEEVDTEIEILSNQTERPKEKVRELLSSEGGMERLKGQIRNRKTLDFVQEKAQIESALQVSPDEPTSV